MSSDVEQKRQEFYARVRKRTIENWTKGEIVKGSPEDKKLRKTYEKIQLKPESPYSLNNVIWLLTSVGVFYLTNFAVVIFYDQRISRRWLYLAAVCFIVASTCFLYCVVWLSWIKKIKSDLWELHNHLVIPIATVSMLLGTIAVCVAAWPVWSILTIPIVGTQIYGFVIFIAMIPDMK